MNTQLATQEFSDPLVVANLMNEHRFGRMMMIAETMASASLIPEHLLGRKKGGTMDWFTPEEVRANCFLIVNQAFRWGMDPFAVMPETYVVGGKLGYQGKLIAGLVNSLGNLEERLSYTYSGTKGTPDFTVTVSGKIKGEKEARTVTVRVGDVKTDNGMWTKDPEQKLVYTGATKWTRRHCPEVILGILTDDDAEQIEMRDVTPRNETPPKVVTGGDQAPAKAAKPTKAEPPVAAAEVVTEPTSIPQRPEMVSAIRSAYRAAGIKNLPDAEETARKAGHLAVGQGFSGLKDEEMFVIFSNLDTIYVAFPEAPENGNGGGEG